MSVETEPGEADRQGRNWLAIIAAVAVAMALVGLIVWSSDPEERDLAAATSTTTAPIVPPSIGSSSTSTTPPATTTTQATTSTSSVVLAERAGVGDLVLGWSGTLYAVVGDGTKTLVRWETERNQGMPVRDAVALPPRMVYYDLDASGELFAFAVWGDNDEVETLHVTSADGPAVDFDFRMRSLAWHASQPGRLALIAERPDGTAHLVTLEFEGLRADRAGARSITDIEPHDEILVWGENGFVIWSHDEEGDQETVRLLDSSGELLWEQAGGREAAMSPSGDVLVSRFLPEGFEFAAIPAEHPEAAETVELPVQGATGAAWSPDGQLLAVHFYEGTGKTWTLQVYDRQGSLIDSSSFEFRVWDVAWSPDQRFILMPGTDDRGTHAILVYDTRARLLTPVGFTTWIHWVSVRE